MKVNKAELQSVLEKVKPGLASKDLIEQATSFAFVGNRVVTYNDEISVSHPVTGLDVTGAVKAKALYDFLSKVKQEEVEIEWEDNQVVISAGKAKAGLVFEQEVKLPLDEEIGEAGEWTSVPTNFIDGLQFCYPCCSHDMSRPVLTCVHVKGDIVESSDSYQIARFQMNKAFQIEPFLIPASAAKELTRYNIREVAQGDGWVHFKAEGDTIFSTRVLNNVFPDTTAHLKVENGSSLTLPQKLTEILHRAVIFSKADVDTGDIPLVAIGIEEGMMSVSAQNDYGWFREDVRVRYNGAPIKFAVGIKFMADIVDRIQDCTIGEDRIGFSGKNWQHVVAMLGDGGPEE